jgi:hypothetical protein
LVFTGDGDLLVSSFFSNSIIKFEDSLSTGTEFTAGYPLNGPLDLLLLPVPEPSIYAMLLVGLGLVGIAAARRKQHI